MFTGSFNRNTRGDNDGGSAEKASSIPGSAAVYVRDLDDVKDAFHGNLSSPGLDPRKDRGSLPTAMLTVGAFILFGIAALGVLGWLSNERVNRTEVSNEVLTFTSCRAVGDQVVYTGSYDRAVGNSLAALDGAAGLEVQVVLLDNNGIKVATGTDWIEFAASPNGTGPDRTASVVFDGAAVSSPRCDVTVWTA